MQKIVSEDKSLCPSESLSHCKAAPLPALTSVNKETIVNVLKGAQSENVI